MKQFDLQATSLCRLLIYQIDDSSYRGIFLIDHLICYGIALLILEKQLFDNYTKMPIQEQIEPFFVDNQLKNYQNWKSENLMKQ